jgi:hypothetical protein
MLELLLGVAALALTLVLVRIPRPPRPDMAARLDRLSGVALALGLGLGAACGLAWGLIEPSDADAARVMDIVGLMALAFVLVGVPLSLGIAVVRSARTGRPTSWVVELSTVLLILGVLAGIAIPNFKRAKERDGPRACPANQKTLAGAMAPRPREGAGWGSTR